MFEAGGPSSRVVRNRTGKSLASWASDKFDISSCSRQKYRREQGGFCDPPDLDRHRGSAPAKGCWLQLTCFAHSPIGRPSLSGSWTCWAISAPSLLSAPRMLLRSTSQSSQADPVAAQTQVISFFHLLQPMRCVRWSGPCPQSIANMVGALRRMEGSDAGTGRSGRQRVRPKGWFSFCKHSMGLRRSKKPGCCGQGRVIIEWAPYHAASSG